MIEIIKAIAVGLVVCFLLFVLSTSRRGSSDSVGAPPSRPLTREERLEAQLAKQQEEIDSIEFWGFLLGMGALWHWLDNDGK